MYIYIYTLLLVKLYVDGRGCEVMTEGVGITYTVGGATVRIVPLFIVGASVLLHISLQEILAWGQLTIIEVLEDIVPSDV